MDAQARPPCSVPVESSVNLMRICCLCRETIVVPNSTEDRQNDEAADLQRWLLRPRGGLSDRKARYDRPTPDAQRHSHRHRFRSAFQLRCAKEQSGRRSDSTSPGRPELGHSATSFRIRHGRYLDLGDLRPRSATGVCPLDSPPFPAFPSTDTGCVIHGTGRCSRITRAPARKNRPV